MQQDLVQKLEARTVDAPDRLDDEGHEVFLEAYLAILILSYSLAATHPASSDQRPCPPAAATWVGQMIPTSTSNHELPYTCTYTYSYMQLYTCPWESGTSSWRIGSAGLRFIDTLTGVLSAAAAPDGTSPGRLSWRASASALPCVALRDFDQALKAPGVHVGADRGGDPRCTTRPIWR